MHVAQQEKRKPTIVDPYISTNMPDTYLKVYHKLAKAFPTIVKKIFCLPLAGKKIKEAIISCPKSSTIKYLPPVVSETASTTAKKADSVIYNMQATLANITRSIDLILLLNLAAAILQLRMDTVHREINLAVKPSHISETYTEPLFKPEALYALVTAKNATRRAGLHKTTWLQTITQPQTINKVFAGRVAAEQKGISRLPLWPSLGKASLLVLPACLCQDFELFIEIGEITKNNNFSILKQSSDYRGDKKKKHNIYIKGLEKTTKSRETYAEKSKTHKSKKNIPSELQNFIGKALNITSTGNVNSFSLRPLNAEACLRAQKQSTSKIDYMDINSISYRACNTELNALKNLIKNMRRAVISVRDIKLKIFTDSSNTAWGIVAGFLTYVPSILNPADVSSRLIAQTELSISDQRFRQLNKLLQGSKAKNFSTQLKIVGKSILLPTFEPDNTSDQKSTPGENNAENYSLVLAKKRKFTLIEKQALALNCMEDQRRAFKNQGLENYAVDFIVYNK
ncbi:hypothetical protein BB561_005458 [Smittium simulii]|uniref:Uncharacterized protein n=1 Tax=Smittium simulii TaxID=133385 RepID=A0A2T9YA96_9FUNG|nr:hypothetical protein BB561_005458 [Smittium simulii]